MANATAVRTAPAYTRDNLRANLGTLSLAWYLVELTDREVEAAVTELEMTHGTRVLRGGAYLEEMADAIEHQICGRRHSDH